MGRRIAANVLAGGGLGLALFGTLCFSAGNLLSSVQQQAGLKPLTTNAWGMLYGALLLLGFCLLTDLRDQHALRMDVASAVWLGTGDGRQRAGVPQTQGGCLDA